MEANPTGRFFIVGVPGVELSAEDRRFLEEVNPSGVCLFARNIKEPAQVRGLTDSIRSILGDDALICLDQEGGRVDRLRRILEPMPSADSLKSTADAAILGNLSGRALRQLGINVNFAPVVDVPRNASENGLQTRTLGADADEITANASSFIEALSATGVMGCLKHFPGLGASSVDSHEMLPLVEIGDDELEICDLVPYRRLVEKCPVMVMIAHATFPNSLFNAENHQLPSSLNPIVYESLRRSVGFKGLAVTDDLEMGAIINSHGIPDASLAALEAGADIALICNDQNAARAAAELCADRLIGSENLKERLETFSRRLEASGIGNSHSFDFDSDEWEHLGREIKELKDRLTRS